MLKCIKLACNSYLDPDMSYTFYFESVDGVDQSAVYFQEDLEERSHIKKVDTGWLLKINAGRY